MGRLPGRGQRAAGLVQVHGGLGYSPGMPVEALYRFARGARFYDGPDEGHRESVGRQLLRGYEP